MTDNDEAEARIEAICGEHIRAWLERERAKGRPEEELTLAAFLAEEERALRAKPEVQAIIMEAAEEILNEASNSTLH